MMEIHLPLDILENTLKKYTSLPRVCSGRKGRSELRVGRRQK